MSEPLAEDKEEDSAPDREDVEGRVGYTVYTRWVLGKKNKFVMHLFKSDCLKPGISGPLSQTQGNWCARKSAQLEGA